MSPSETSPDDQALAEELVASYQKIKEQVHQVIVGQEKVLEQLLIAMLARGHCLLEGVPGLAKTLMIRSLAQAIDLVSKDSIYTRSYACRHNWYRYHTRG